MVVCVHFIVWGVEKLLSVIDWIGVVYSIMKVVLSPIKDKIEYQRVIVKKRIGYIGLLAGGRACGQIDLHN